MAQHYSNPKRRGHIGEYAVNCPACITEAEKQRTPRHASYIDVFSSSAGDPIKRKHMAALKRQGRAQARVGIMRRPENEKLTTSDLLGVLHNYVLSQGALHMAKLVDHLIVRVAQMEQELHLLNTVGQGG